MSAVNVSEEEFGVVFAAAHAAKDRGDMRAARQLDKLARKISASLTNEAGRRLPMAGMFRRMPGHKPFTWRDVPSVFDAPKVGA